MGYRKVKRQTPRQPRPSSPSSSHLPIHTPLPTPPDTPTPTPTPTSLTRRHRRTGLQRHLPPQAHDPLIAQEFRRGRALRRVPLETLLQETDALGAQLVAAGQLGRVALRDVVHDGPLVVEQGPGPAAGRHFEDDAAERPDVDGAVPARRRLAFDDFGRHVHGRAGHGFLAAAAVGVAVGERLALARDDFGRAEVDVFDDAVVVEEDV